jgi:hypothetical protein
VAGPPGQGKQLMDIGQDIALQDRQKDEMLRHLATLGRIFPHSKDDTFLLILVIFNFITVLTL